MSESDTEFHIPEEKLSSFYNKMDQWVSQQGFLFQLRYGSSSKKIRGSRWLITLFLRFLIVALIAISITAYLLSKRTSSPKFWNTQKNSLATMFAAESVEMSEISYDKGRAEIRNFTIQGGENSFFRSLEGSSLNFKMGFFAGLAGDWDAGAIKIDTLDATLSMKRKEGEAQEAMLSTLFPETSSFTYSYLDVRSFGLRWGSSEADKGSISDSEVRIEATGKDSWLLKFKGGLFSQAWMKNLKIEEIEAILTKEGLNIKKALFSAGERGRIELSASANQKSVLEGNLRFVNLPLTHLNLSQISQIREGSISGEGKVTADLFDKKGLKADLRIELFTNDFIKLSDSIPVLRALTVVDSKRNYKSVNFSEGSFSLKLSPQNAEFSKIEMEASDLFTLRGEFTSKIKYEENIRNELILNSVSEQEPSFSSTDFAEEGENPSELETRLEDLILPDFSNVNPDSVVTEEDKKRLKSQREEALVKRELSPLLKGKLMFILKPDVFDNTVGLQSSYPAEGANVILPLVLNERLYEISEEIAEELLEKGVRKFK